MKKLLLSILSLFALVGFLLVMLVWHITHHPHATAFVDDTAEQQ